MLDVRESDDASRGAERLTSNIQHLTSAPPCGALSIHLDRIDDADDRGVYRCVFAAVRHARRAALDDQHDFAESRADRIDGDDMAFLVLPIDADGAGDEQFLAVQALILARR